MSNYQDWFPRIKNALSTAQASVLGSAADSAATIAQQLPARANQGLDGPVLHAKDDVLNRSRIAREIYRLISETPKDQSVRVGLFGDWGYGKTTIALWVRDLAEADGNIVVWFNPWSARSIPELWAEFASALHDALIANDIKVPSWSGLKAAANRVRTDYGELAGSLAGGRVAGVANSLLRFSRHDIEAIGSQLNGRRVVVCIDDIDRVDPTLLPGLLLSLRELLDLPGFAFVVPFEKRIVSDALLKIILPGVAGNASSKKFSISR